MKIDQIRPWKEHDEERNHPDNKSYKLRRYADRMDGYDGNLSVLSFDIYQMPKGIIF